MVIVNYLRDKSKEPFKRLIKRLDEVSTFSHYVGEIAYKFAKDDRVQGFLDSLDKYDASLSAFSIPSGLTGLAEKLYIDRLSDIASYVIKEGESLSWPGWGWELGKEVLGKIIPNAKYGSIAKTYDGFRPLVPELTKADKVIYRAFQSGELARNAALFAITMGFLGLGAYKLYKSRKEVKQSENKI